LQKKASKSAHQSLQLATVSAAIYMARANSWSTDSFVDFGIIYIVCLFTSYASPFILFSSLFSLLFFSF